MLRFDWKFAGQLILAALAVIVTVWIYYTDLGSRSLHMHTISRIPLQPQEASAVPGLQISFEGQELQTPYITVLEIVNDGLRPIPATSFELPLEIWTAVGVKIVRAEVTERTPRDLQPDITWADNLLKLKPLLLNPNDSIKFMLITSGGTPEFSPKARIEGVTSITQDTKVKKFELLSVAQAFVVFALLIIHSLGWDGFFRSVSFRRRTMLFIMVVSFCGSIITAIRVVQDQDLGLSPMKVFLAQMIVFILAERVATLINRKSDHTSGANED